jgi:predicted nucleotidyltransferase component of viral defense system
MQFKVTPEERKLIEKVAKKKDFTVSEYVRASVIMDMVLDGEVGAMKIVVDTIGRKAVQALRKRADQLADLGAEATDSQ